MAIQKKWSHDEQLLALRLYLTQPFGRLHQTAKEVVETARLIERTPSAVAMKACNFASLDPEFRKTNRTGLKGASQADRELWANYLENTEELSASMEKIWLIKVKPEVDWQNIELWNEKPTERDATVKVRLAQSVFRRSVLAAYGLKCAITGVSLPEILVASHIYPWSREPRLRANPRNGICLNVLFDKAFDRGLISFDQDLCLLVSKKLGEAAKNARYPCSILEVKGARLNEPERFSPLKEALDFHRNEIFVDAIHSV